MNIIADIASQDLTHALAEQARTLSLADLPGDVRTLARQCVLDYVACTLAGAREELTDILLAEATEQGGAPVATVIGHGVRLPVLSAALVNGAASHALDFDDVNLAMTGHPSVVLLSALLALAEERGSSGRDVLTAFVAGYELQCRLGLLLAPGHYNTLGFHATGTLGSFGAAAACAHLLGLGEEKFATALGIAGTQAAGLKSMFGTMCKPLHAGKAAYHGLLAARLAQRGFTSRSDVLECAQGFARTHSPDFNPAAALAEPPGGFHIRNNLFKYHAACYMTHAPIEAARRLREAARPDPRQYRAHQAAARRDLRPYLQHPRAAHGPGGEVQPAAHHRDGARRRRYRRARQLLGGDRRRSHAGRAARQGGTRLRQRPAEHDRRPRTRADRRSAGRDVVRFRRAGERHR